MKRLLARIKYAFSLLAKPFKPTKLEELKRRGLKLGKDVSIQPEVVFDHSHCFLITIGDRVTLAPRAYILAHDASTKRHLGYTKIGKVKIGNDTFVGAGAIILPGVTIGEKVIIGAGSVVSRDIPDGAIVAGNPAVVVGQTQEMLAKHRERMKTRPVYPNAGHAFSNGMTEDNKQKMIRELADGIGYLE